MIYRTPEYYRRFRCIAGDCRDSCCIGWEIDIDSETAGYYASVGGEFGDRLRDSISGGSFVLAGNDRCPFLNGCGLCDIYTELGEEHLCQICTDHPRYYEWFGKVKEGGIGMCCEEAARLILSSDHVLVESDADDEDCPEYDEELFELLLSAREEITGHILRDGYRESMRILPDYAGRLQENIDNGDYTLPEWKQTCAAGEADPQAVMEFFASLEPIDPEWIPYLHRCAAKGDDLPELPEEYELYLRRAAVYFLYRYFLKGTFDGEIVSRAGLAAVSAWLIGRLWRFDMSEQENYGFEDCAWTAKNYSKEIEYSIENLEALSDAFYTEPSLSASALIGLFGK